MVSSNVIKENWGHLQKQIQKKWSQFSPGELDDFDGSTDELIARIQAKTNESRESIQNFIQSASEEGSSMVNRMKEQVSDGLSAAREGAEQTVDRVRDGYREVQHRMSDSVQEHPGISLATAFGLGVLTGVGLSLLLFDSEPEPMARRYSRNAEEQGRRFWNALVDSLPSSISQRLA